MAQDLRKTQKLPQKVSDGKRSLSNIHVHYGLYAVCGAGGSCLSYQGFIDETKMDQIEGYAFYVRYSTLLHLPPLRFRGVGGCRECQTLLPFS